MYLAIVLLYAGCTLASHVHVVRIIYYYIYIIIIVTRSTLILLCSIPAIVWSHDQSEEEGDQWTWAGGCFKENKLIERRTRENNYYCNYDDLCTFVL